MFTVWFHCVKVPGARMKLRVQIAPHSRRSAPGTAGFQPVWVDFPTLMTRRMLSGGGGQLDKELGCWISEIKTVKQKQKRFRIDLFKYSDDMAIVLF